MTEYTIQCGSDAGDTLTVCRQGEEIEFVSRSHGSFAHSVYPTSDGARTFARGILALADEVDGGEAKEAPETASGRMPEADSPFKVGDKVRTVREILELHRGRAGELAAIDISHAPNYWVRFPDGGSVWAYDIEPTPAHEPLADWERELLAHEPTATPTRMDLLEQARALVGSRDVPNLLAVARFLAGDNA